MIRITSLQVKSFKSLIDTTIDKFDNINMFYGYNNSGKSNVFKFLKLLFERKKIGTKVKYNSGEEGGIADAKSSLRIQTTNFWNGNIWNEPFLFTNNDRTKPITFKVELEVDNSLFPKSDILLTLNYLKKDQNSTILELVGTITEIDFETSEFRIIEAKLNDQRFYKFEDELSVFFEDFPHEELTQRVGESILNIFDDLVILIDSDRNFTTEISKDGIDNMDVKNFKNGLYELNINAEKNEKFNKLLAFLGSFDFSSEAKNKLGTSIKSFPFKTATDLGFAKFENEIEIMLRNESGRFPLRNYGTGIQQFLYILSRISQNKARIVIVEELELNLSPLYQVELLRFLISLIPEKLYDQLIFSSHSPFFTQKDATMINIIHHVQIGLIQNGGTSVDCHDNIPTTYDETTGQSYLSLLYS